MLTPSPTSSHLLFPFSKGAACGKLDTLKTVWKKPAPALAKDGSGAAAVTPEGEGAAAATAGGGDVGVNCDDGAASAGAAVVDSEELASAGKEGGALASTAGDGDGDGDDSDDPSDYSDDDEDANVDTTTFWRTCEHATAQCSGSP